MINSFLKWAATLITILGAIATSLKNTPLNVYLLNTGALLFLMWSFRIKEWSLVVVNGVLVAIYAIGIFYK